MGTELKGTWGSPYKAKGLDCKMGPFPFAAELKISPEFIFWLSPVNLDKLSDFIYGKETLITCFCPSKKVTANTYHLHLYNIFYFIYTS